jgi:hypothetical protein
MIYCPYCQTDLASLHHEICSNAKLENLDNEKICTIVMCTECGEPLIVRSYDFRKPTADEHVGMVLNGRLREARDAFIHMKENGPIISFLWKQYHGELLGKSLTTRVLNTDHKLYIAAQDIFFAGTAVLVAFVKDTINSDPEKFVSRMMLIEAELKAYEEYSREPREKVAE